MGRENLREWSRNAWKELEALELRDAEQEQPDCCRYWTAMRRHVKKMESYISLQGPVSDIRFCPACGRKLK